MGNVKSGVLIENENLFRALVCTPIAILFVMLAANSVMSSGIVLFQVIFVVLALYFSLSTLAYAAFYTNDHHMDKVDSIFENKNFFNMLFYTPLAISFVFFAVNSVSSSSHIFFNVLFVLIALYCTLKTLAYAAYYTNDYHAAKADLAD